MKNIHFTLFLTTLSLAAALTGPKLVSGTLGGAVTIRCQYHAYYKNNEKYLCKGSNWKSCSILVKSASQHKNIDDRIIMVDNQTAGEFITKVTQLSANDAGLYWCGIEKFGYDKMVPVQLNVTEAALTGPELVSGTLGGAVTIRCQYHAYYKNNEKYLCKGSDWKSCSVLVNSASQHKNIDDRIIMVDNQTAGEFITEVTQLSANDAGLYWCGIVQLGNDKMFPVQLNVTEGPTTQPPTIPPELQETIHQGNLSSVHVSILLGSIFGILIVTAIFVTKCRKYSAATSLGEEGISYKEEEYNAVCNSVFSRDDEEDKLSDVTTDKSSTQTEETFRDIDQTPDHEEKGNFSCQN